MSHSPILQICTRVGHYALLVTTEHLILYNIDTKTRSRFLVATITIIA